MMTSSYTKPYYDPSEEIVESFEGSGGIDEAVSNLIKTVRLWFYCEVNLEKFRDFNIFVNKFIE